MSYNAAPSAWLGAGYTLASHVISANTNSASSNKTFTELTDTEADPTTGDIRKVMYAIAEKFYASYQAQASADRPVKMTITRSTLENSSGALVRSYNLQFVLDGSGLDVASE